MNAKVKPFDYLCGALGGMAFVHALSWLNPPPPTEEERRHNMVRVLNPKPIYMFIDPKMIEIFHDLSLYRKFSKETEEAFVQCQELADRTCGIALRVDKGELPANESMYKKIQRSELLCLKKLAKIYRIIKISEADDIVAREKSRIWRESASKIGTDRTDDEDAPSMAKDVEQNRDRSRRRMSSTSSSTAEAETDDKSEPVTLKNKLKHDIIRMYYAELMTRLGKHVTFVGRRWREDIKIAPAPFPGSERKPRARARVTNQPAQLKAIK